jgi:hypothetical protein
MFFKSQRNSSKVDQSAASPFNYGIFSILFSLNNEVANKLRFTTEGQNSKTKPMILD